MVVQADFGRMLVVVVMSVLRICLRVTFFGGIEDNHSRHSAMC
jgi:hypothetical protein